MSDQTQDHPGASGELPHWWANVPKPLQHGTGEYQQPGYPTTTAFGIATRFVPGPLNSGRLNQALDELQAQIGTGGGGIAEAPSDGSAYGRLNAAWAKVAPLAAPTFTGTVRAPVFVADTGIQVIAGNITAPSGNVSGVNLVATGSITLNGVNAATTAQLPAIATTAAAGLVKPDGVTITVDGAGRIVAAGDGGITDAPTDGASYGRLNNAWARVLSYSGDVVDGGNF